MDTITTTEFGLLQGICATPRDDTPRLAYADWLDEQPTIWVKCPGYSCGHDAKPGHVRVNSGRHYKWGEPREKVCPKCGGRGEVPDDSVKLRAEFIRVQCELARLLSCDELQCHHIQSLWCQKCRPLRNQEKPLYAKARHEWQGAFRGVIPKGARIDDRITFTRGFISSLTCAAADWLAHADALVWVPEISCEGCYIGGVTADPDGYTVKTEHQVWGSYSRTEEYPKKPLCRLCRGKRLVPNSRPFVPTAQPLESVTLNTALGLFNGPGSDPHNDDLWLVPHTPPHTGQIDGPSSPRLRANTIAANARRLGTNNWITAMCDLLWPGIEFTLRGNP